MDYQKERRLKSDKRKLTVSYCFLIFMFIFLAIAIFALYRFATIEFVAPTTSQNNPVTGEEELIVDFFSASITTMSIFFAKIFFVLIPPFLFFPFFSAGAVCTITISKLNVSYRRQGTILAIIYFVVFAICIILSIISFAMPYNVVTG